MPLPAPSPEETTRLLLATVRAQGLAAVLDEDARELVARVRLLAAFEEGWPDLGADALMASLDEWLGPGLAAAGSLKALKNAGGGGVGRLIEAALLTFEQQGTLQRAAPTSIVTPAGTSAKLRYAKDDAGGGAGGSAGGPGGLREGSKEGSGEGSSGGGGSGIESPVLESKLQEWFGASDTPRVGPRGQVLALYPRSTAPPHHTWLS